MTQQPGDPQPTGSPQAPDVPLRMELTFELPGTPEQVWEAIATAEGIGSWFLRTDLDERVGGTIVTHMGDGDASKGTVTGFEPPHRFAYEEPDWASLVGRDAPVTPLATEFLVEARSGGTCTLRVVSSAFGVGADWEREFFESMEASWKPSFDNLRVYLRDFPGQRAAVLSAQATLPASGAALLSQTRAQMGADAVGQDVRVRDLTGRVELLDPVAVLVRVAAPVPGYVQFAADDGGDGQGWVQVQGYFFSAEAPDYVRREEPGWRAWLTDLAGGPARER